MSSPTRKSDTLATVLLLAVAIACIFVFYSKYYNEENFDKGVKNKVSFDVPEDSDTDESEELELKGAYEDSVGAPITLTPLKDFDKYDINNYLPQERRDDWFDGIEAIDIKNEGLINTYRPQAIDTVGSSLKIPSYDPRGYGDAVAPKGPNGPFLQSSIEPAF